MAEIAGTFIFNSKPQNGAIAKLWRADAWSEGNGSEVRYYHTDSNLDNVNSYGGDVWGTQMFTATATHIITKVRLPLSRYPDDFYPGTITVSIRITSGGLPAGDDLTSGTTDGDTLPVYPAFEWREIILPIYILINENEYAPILRAANGDDTGAYWWTNGNSSWKSAESNDAGINWELANIEHIFEEWGIGLPIQDDPEPDAEYQVGDTLKTGVQYGGDGAFRFTDVPAGEYYVSCYYDNHRAWLYIGEMNIHTVLMEDEDLLIKRDGVPARLAIESEGEKLRIIAGKIAWA